MHFSSSTIAAALLSPCSSTAFSIAAMWLLTSSSLMTTVAQAADTAAASDDDGNSSKRKFASMTDVSRMHPTRRHRRLATPNNDDHEKKMEKTLLDYEYDHNKNGKDINIDAGILSSSFSSSSSRGLDAAAEVATTLTTPSPAEVCGASGFVECVQGIVSGTAKTCASECGQNCCVGHMACDKFTGKVCKDGSCSGDYACHLANIPWVVKSCKNGSSTCAWAGFDNGMIANMVNSCRDGDFSCSFLGSFSAKVGEIRDSCTGFEACTGLSSYGSDKVVGNILNSCQGTLTCDDIANGYYGFPNQGDMINICHGDSCCRRASSSPPINHCSSEYSTMIDASMNKAVDS